MTWLRSLGLLLAAASLQAAQEEHKTPAQRPRPPAEAQEPVEEDPSFATREYAFNPLQAAKEVKVGNFYFKKGSYKAAAGRFEEATRWNPGMTEAWLRLGQAREKLKDTTAAREAYARYIQLDPESRQAKALGKKIAAWK